MMEVLDDDLTGCEVRPASVQGPVRGTGVCMKRVLLVGCHGVFRQAIGLLLGERLGQDSVQAGSLAEAGRMLASVDREVALAIVDLDLPDGDGVALVRALRQTGPDVSVLAIVSGNDLERRSQALREGANEVHLTTWGGDDLLAAAQRLLGG